MEPDPDGRRRPCPSDPFAAPAAQAAGREAPREAYHDRDNDRDRDHDRDHDRWRWHRHFEVMYRPCCDAPWAYYGRYDDRRDAERTELYPRDQGFEAFVRD